MKVKLYQSDYKGKHYVLEDYKDDMYYSESVEIDLDTFDWVDHVASCRYYGIPSYIGANENVQDRIALAEISLPEEIDLDLIDDIYDQQYS